MMKCSTGVRVAVRTHATTLSLRVRCTQLATEDGNRIASNSFVAAVDGVDHTEVPTPLDADALIPLSGGELIEASRRAESSLVSFEGLPPGDKTVEVWLPQGAIVDLLAIESDAPVDPAPMPPGRTWLHHGSSISHCIEPQRPTSTWPVVAARAAGVSVVNLSGAGQCHLDPFMSDAIAQTPADVISLKLGVNNVGGRSMDQRTFVPAVHGFIDRIRHAHADRLVMANIAQTVNVLQAMILTDPDSGALVLTPTYHVFRMNVAHHDAASLQVHLDAPAARRDVGGVELRTLSMSASTTGNTALISLTNLDAEAVGAVVLDLRGRTVVSQRARILTAPTLQAHNTPEAPDAVSVRDYDVTSDETAFGTGLRVELPPHSYVTVALELAG